MGRATNDQPHQQEAMCVPRDSFGPLIDHLLEDDGGPGPANISGEERMDLTEAMKQQVIRRIDEILTEVATRPLSDYGNNLTEVQALILQRILDRAEPRAEEIKNMSQHDLVFNTIAVFVTLGFVIQDRLEEDLFPKTEI